MPRLHVICHDFDLTDAEAAPLIAADILYWDTMGDSDRPDDEEVTDPDHLHLNPEMVGFDDLEAAVVREGLAPLRRFAAERIPA